MAHVRIGGRVVGDAAPCYVIGEIGLNHNGDVDIARQLIDAAVSAGCDAVKFQKRTPEISTPKGEWDLRRETPWGTMSYIDYRRRIELGESEYRAIDDYARERAIPWFASCWDEGAVEFIERFDPPAYKIASACLTDHSLIKASLGTGKPVILSTGMSTLDQIAAAVDLLPADRSAIAHSTSTYPCPVAELNLRAIQSLKRMFPDRVVGYSGHEVGLQTTVAAVVLGAAFVERHITLDRAMWGSDQSASVEPQGLVRLVRDIRTVEQAFGDGEKRVYDSELGPMKKLRRTP
jgi:N-acetylneuraminate synthase